MDISLSLVETGLPGLVDVVSVEQNAPVPLSTLPFGLPPTESVDDQLKKYLDNVHNLPIHDTEKCQKFLPRKPDPGALFSIDVTPIQHCIKVTRNPTTGQVLGIVEEYKPDTSATAKNSTSLQRPPGPPGESIRGSTTNYPFWPGGLDEPSVDDITVDSTNDEQIDFVNNLLTTPPGLAKGMTFHDQKSRVVEEKVAPSVITMADILSLDNDLDLGDEVEDVTKTEELSEKYTEDNSETLDSVVQVDEAQVESDTHKKEPKPDDSWAVKVDISKNVTDFHDRIPDMAYKWPFELDTFQKQAILHLENHESVFVAAHTSAGKTVVAEYAIALSLKHMTRTIYTSPIKALSNQKFRDFKTTFENVGLITGDVQLRPDAHCLIMTTEILRSMLYNGSDVIRDLEWVIFDEVHYINDAERGVVWEEVLIMLPSHVNIILLSATVPNTLEFADWIGRTKKKKIYVISTLKRPVPLEHYLYTGNSNKTSNELFMILDSARKFDTRGYQKALDAKKERSSKSSQSFGAKGHRGGHPMQEKNIWLSVIEMLRKKEKLPVIVFTFSKKRIDENASHLQSVDMLTAIEKSEVHIFIQKCISKLKGTDRELPQVKHMSDLLKRGIGVHHSGILPILKEVVEMLFQRQLVKVLFATETFAMGVNMPARTVVFDSIRKHDGTNFRNLQPGEYIQMAGRAGRRGLDTTGTVILLCKGDVPEMSDLHQMMLGKPTKLESQFRLTYSMILNLLRVDELRVEDMMKRSFSEAHWQKDLNRRQETLKDLKSKLAQLKPVECFMCCQDLENYYSTCDEYWRLRSRLQKVVLGHPHCVKSMNPGRVVLIDNPVHPFCLGIIVKCSSGYDGKRTLSALVIPNPDKDQEYDSVRPGPYLAKTLYQPDGPSSHEIIELSTATEDILVITTKTLKISGDKIIDDVRKRSQPRFRNDPPSQSVTMATQELLRLTEANPLGLPGLDPINDLGIRDIELVEEFRTMNNFEKIFETFSCIKCAKFRDHFNQIRDNMMVQKEFKQMSFLSSEESLQLLPEYEQRMEVLRKVNYINEHNAVDLKGRVACAISNHELLITELVFDNILTSLQPTEIAAILSCVVFEQKHCSEPNLCPALLEGKEAVIRIATKIGELQKNAIRLPVGDYVDSFHFGLMEVVFEWSRGMPFSEITTLTDIQEGIIVRSIQRLDEVIKDVRNAARIIGDPILYSKMEDASARIKRDIVFAASLYTQ